MLAHFEKMMGVFGDACRRLDDEINVDEANRRGWSF